METPLKTLAPVLALMGPEGLREKAQVRGFLENVADFPIRDACPEGQVRMILGFGDRRNPYARFAGVVRPAQREVWECAVNLRANNRVAHHELVTAPSGRGAGMGGGGHGSVKNSVGVGGDVPRYSQFNRGFVKSRHRLAQIAH